MDVVSLRRGGAAVLLGASFGVLGTGLLHLLGIV